MAYSENQPPNIPTHHLHHPHQPLDINHLLTTPHPTLILSVSPHHIWLPYLTYKEPPHYHQKIPTRQHSLNPPLYIHRPSLPYSHHPAPPPLHHLQFPSRHKPNHQPKRIMQYTWRWRRIWSAPHYLHNEADNKNTSKVSWETLMQHWIIIPLQQRASWNFWKKRMFPQHKAHARSLGTSPMLLSQK